MVVREGLSKEVTLKVRFDERGRGHQVKSTGKIILEKE